MDDAPENLNNWPLLYALGAPDVMLRMFKKGWEGHLRQYTADRQRDVPSAREDEDEMYYMEFHAMFDQAHINEGLWAFYQQGLATPPTRNSGDGRGASPASTLTKIRRLPLRP